METNYGILMTRQCFETDKKNYLNLLLIDTLDTLRLSKLLRGFYFSLSI